ncbi:MAG: ATP-binding cassette domain-containing protein [Oculatellaceae cyanobacterium Prado106]|jgi:peptide/nickel transport system ATP-binding protein/Fe3+-transporting ATPase|nr:ATP-binding cassette domain-containing protein [Oculatellaceae cyanobacterium Prado106]
MLIANQLSFRYTAKQPWILRDFSVAITPGEVVGLRGPSGFGKTTIAKLLAGYELPSAGMVTVDGRPLGQRGYAPVQLIFQNPELAVNPRWRIRQILQEGHRPTADLLADLGIHSGWLDRYPHELSGGELQRIAVARVLHPTTRYLIADEMTAMLDANTQALIWQSVLRYTQHHKIGLLVISHEDALLKRVCDRIIDLYSHSPQDATQMQLR